ncbi:phenylalanine--tRNA ligase subunit beta [bacterium B13(2017)]|nr:phenylalanine--tRNA ligase subunit beta [bacterium B13(2017)]
MKVSLNWLQEYFDFEVNVEEMLTNLPMVGLEVESVTSIDPMLSNVVTAKILSISDHPNADNLKVCKVHDGKENLQIVCGANNIRVGQIAPLAKVETAKIRDIDSYGMLCSEKELQLGYDESGVLIFPDNIEIGKSIKEFYHLTDTIIDIGITPNRGDCLSVRGIAREVAASFNKKCKYRILPPVINQEHNFFVNIINKELCPVYGGAIIHDVNITKSPFDLRYKLFLTGIRPINNIVDITNFILIDIGQPMHAFDLDKLQGEEIQVRLAKENETILTLDGIDRHLSMKDLIIADNNSPIAVAGVMGGELTSVDEKTRRIFFESAFFNPLTVRKTSKRLNLVSESSYRFERGVDPYAISDSLLLACEMSTNFASAKIINSEINLKEFVYPKKTIMLRTERCNKLLGIDLNDNEIENLLGKIEVIKDKNNSFIIPGFRNDLDREVDLIEDVARIYGYVNIPENNEEITVQYKDHALLFDFKKQIRELMVRLGLSETINYSFVSSNDILNIDNFVISSDNGYVIENPLSPEQSIMRNSLIPGLLMNFVNSNNYKVSDIKIFELGAVFHDVNQREHLAIVQGGKILKSYLDEKEREFDFYDIKGMIEELFYMLNIPIEYKSIQNSMINYGYSVICDGKIIGVFGELTREFLKKYSCKERIFFGEFNIEDLLLFKNDKKKFVPICRFPFIIEDISFIIDENIKHKDIVEIILNKKIHILEKISIFDIYKGKNIPDGKKSVAYSITYRNRNGTLLLEEVNKIHESIKKDLKEKLNAKLR